jgi:tRNA (mo5U34)-methyltransferase
MARRLRSGFRRRRPAAARRYESGQLEAPLVELLDDADLEALNALLPWHCFTVDRRGRPLGRPAWNGKRDVPEQIPDPRIERFDARFGLRDSHVLEVGCFEGIHTIALCDRADRVTAVDGRIENVVKTIVRCSMFGRHPTVVTCDLERPEAATRWLRADLCHHVGVLYHLTDPVRHLRRLGTWIGRGLMLDTHYSEPESTDDSYDVDGERVRFKRFGEGRADPFSGMQSHAKWITLDAIEAELRSSGFDAVEIVERRQERNGPRVLLFAEKTGASAIATS